jgi:hypothetical protein
VCIYIYIICVCGTVVGVNVLVSAALVKKLSTIRNRVLCPKCFVLVFFFFFYFINACFGVFTLQFMRHVACVSCTLFLSLGGSTEDLCHLLLWVMGLSIVCMNTLGLGH